ncbi:MAG: methyltransferase domain-containing protein [Betaproteobacteria bacterium]|jgi:SAM-dependent methyltransferase
MRIIEFGGEQYPEFQAEGFAAKFAFPYARQVCRGNGYDVGANCAEWTFPNAIGIDSSFEEPYNDALNLPTIPEWESGYADYIFSSHCLEHIPDWVRALDHWTVKIRPGGVMFLYLPDFSQKYWRPWNNTKHVSVFTPEIIRSYFEDSVLWTNIFVSGIDLNNSFMLMAERV